MKNSQSKTIYRGIEIFIVLWLCNFVAPVAASEELVDVRTYKLPKLGTIELTVPKEWIESVKIPDGPFPIKITFMSPSEPYFLFSVIPPSLDENEKIKIDVTGDEIKKALHNYADTMKYQVIESYVWLLELKGPFIHGYYFRVTSREPIEAKFRYLTQGIVQVGELPISFNIFSNNGQSKLENAALSVIQSAKPLP
jgi:hypothetical protein